MSMFFRMPKRKYKKFLEQYSTIKIPCPRLESRHLHDDCKDPHTADVETRSPSGHPDMDFDSDDTADPDLACAGDHRDQRHRTSPNQSTANVETRSPSGHPDHEVDPDDMADPLLSSPGRCLRTSVMQTSDLAQQFGCDSSSEGCDISETEDPPEDDPFRQIGSDTDMDCLLMSAGTTTKAEALLMVMSHAARHNITGTQLDDLLKLINTLFDKEVLPRSKYLFNKVFKNNSEIVDFQFYCKTCKIYIGTQEYIKDKNIAQCAICSAPIEISSLNSASFFINIPIAPQVQALLENPEIQNGMCYRHQRPRNDHVISDIYDGEKYQNLSKPGGILSDPNNLSFNFNSDGSPAYKSSKFSIWPIQLHLRVRKWRQ
ncbi:hypothetical protein ABVT39_023428 [Epinephelus coioides]